MTYLEGLPEPLASQPSPGPGRGRRIAVAIASVAVVLAGVFAAVNIASGEENEPTDPVRAMIEAAERGDAIGILEQLDPGERDAVRGPLEELTAELNRLGVLEGASLAKLTGYELDVSGLELTATEVRDGLQRVRIVNGKSTFSVDPSKMPFGPFVRDLAGDALAEGKSSGSSDLVEEGDDSEIVVIKRGGRWYVSYGYSLAEAARRDSGVSVASMGPGVTAKGADSPEDAVRDFLLAASEIDVRRLIELLPPDEMGALQDYAGLFLDEVERSTADARQAFPITLPTLELDADTDGGRSLVKIRKISVQANLGGATFGYEDGCLTVGGPGQEPMEYCRGSDLSQFFSQYFGMDIGMSEPLQPPVFSFEDKKVDVGIVATRVDGKWYVSPTRTVLDSFVTVLKVVQPSDLEKARDWVLGLQEAFVSMLTVQSESVESPTATTYEVPDNESSVSVPRTGY